MDTEQYKFRCEHFEERSQMWKDFILTVYAPPRGRGQPEISLFDLKNGRVFLKRGVYDQDGPIRLQDLHLQGTVTICARKLTVVEYSDEKTREFYEATCNQVHVLVGPGAMAQLGAMLSAATNVGLTVKRIRTLDRGGSGRFAAIELAGPNAVGAWQQAVQGSTAAGCAAAVSAQPATLETARVFESKQTTALYGDCSLCIVRPHAMREGLAGEVLVALASAELEVTALQTYSLLKSQAETILEVYKTVVPSAQYHATVNELCSGLCLAVEVCHPAGGTVAALRDLCGPHDVEIGRHLRPNTLRARFGRDNVHNVVHCTDLPEDGVLESQYFFSILPGAS